MLWNNAPSLWDLFRRQLPISPYLKKQALLDHKDVLILKYK